MKIVKPVYYKNFRCIAGDCPDSCCQGWEVDADRQSLSFYKSLDPSLEIRQRIDRVLDKDEFGNTIFTLAPEKRCPFLNGENLCDMHIAIGKEHTPYTCRTFPRFIYDFGGTREIGISLSCPVASEMIYDLNSHLTFETEINSDPPALNDIDAVTYFTLIKARQEAFSIIQDENLHITQRLSSLLDLALALQTELDDYKEGTDDTDFFDVFRNPEVINREWADRIETPNIKPIENTLYNENIAAYFIYKYFMQALYDSDILSKVKMAVIGVLINTYFGESSWTVHLWSKETEHSQYNMDRYKQLLKNAECLSAAELKKRLIPFKK